MKTTSTSARMVISVDVTSPHCHVHEEEEEEEGVNGLCSDCDINKPHKLYIYTKERHRKERKIIRKEENKKKGSII